MAISESQMIDIANDALKSYPLSVKEVSLINNEYNATFKVVTTDNQQFALRVNINSPRTTENLKAEVSWVNHLHKDGRVKVAQPIETTEGELFVSIKHEYSPRELHCVLYSWLPGSEFDDEPELVQLKALGEAMAQMHIVARDFALPSDSNLPILDDVMWWTEDFLLSERSVLDQESKDLISQALQVIDAHIRSLYIGVTPIVIHADLHGANVLWSENSLSVLDFDDSGIGLPVQDLATAIYYLDTPEQDGALREGYSSVATLPEMSERDLEVFLMQRRIILLNYLYETTNEEHRAMIPDYLVESLRRINIFLRT
jgi:Ser/Thr protein kinase RdoA (MazF antagonist)